MWGGVGPRIGLRSLTVAARLLVLLAFASGCIDDSLVRCGDVACPLGNVCTPGGCAAPIDVTACEGQPEGMSCNSSTGVIGTCQGGACRTGLCGNGVVDLGEACDDGNQVSGDGCRGDCKKMEVCGDGELDANEQCDDGNHNPADGCDACKTTAWQISLAVGTAVLATGAALATPSGVAIDGQGRVFVADTYNHRVERIETDGSVTTVAGTGSVGYNGDGITATSAQLSYPTGVAVDGLGRVFIADSQNNRIRRIDIDGTISTLAGNGKPGYDQDNQPAILASLNQPQGVAVDGLGNVVIADTLNERVRRVDVSGTITTVAGTGNEGYKGDGMSAKTADLDTPYSVAVDSIGRTIIADTLNQRIRRVELDGTINTVAGDGSLGSGGDGGPATSAQLSYPLGVAADTNGQIFIADTFSQEIRRVDTSGNIATIAGNGTIGFGGDGGAATAAQMQYAQGVAVDAAGHVAIADTNNERIRWVSSGTISTIAGNGEFGFGGDGGAATSAHLSGAFGCAADSAGHVFIADTFDARIRRVELDGTITTVAGTGSFGISGDGGPATQAQLGNPDYVAVDSLGRVILSDTYSHSVRRVELDGTIHTIAGTGTPGYNGDGILAVNAQLSNPNGVAVDAQNRVYVVDTYNHRVRRIELDNTISTIAGNGTLGGNGDGLAATSAQLNYPYGIAIDATGRVVIGDTGNHRVRRVELDGTIDTIAGNGTGGYNMDGIAATSAELFSPYGVAVDANGRVVIADDGNNRVRRIETNGTISTVAGTGVSGASGDAGPATSAQLAGPLSVAVDGQNRIVIMDTSNQRVRRIEADGTIFTVAGQIDPDHIGPVAQARLEDPQAIVVGSTMTLVAGGTSGALEAIMGGRVVDVAGEYPQSIATGALARFRTGAFGSVGGTAIDPTTGAIYLTETTANRIHVVTPVNPADPKTWTIATLANASGAPGFADGKATTASFREPRGLWLAGTTLYIADSGNHAIRALDLTDHTVTTVANVSGTLGFGGDGAAATSALLFKPSAITQCSNGDLFIADTGNNRVRRITAGTISTVLGDGVPASSGEGTPAMSFPVDAPRGLACDSFGNLFVSSSSAVRMLAANDAGVVDGAGAVQTIYGRPPRAMFPASVTTCLTGIAVTGPAAVQVADACTGLLVELDRL